MLDDASLSQKLYPSMESPSQPEPQNAQAVEKAQEDKLYTGRDEEYKSPFDEPEEAPLTSDSLASVFEEHGLTANEDTKGFVELANNQGLGKEGVEKLLQLHSDHTEKAWATLSKTWAKETHNTVAMDDIEAAREVVQNYGDEGFVELLEVYGLGNNPSVVSFLARIGKEMKP